MQPLMQRHGAGIALGGGLGIGGSRVGPSVDSVLGIDVVSTWQKNTSDWDIVRINATSHADLFWGMLVSLSECACTCLCLWLLQCLCQSCLKSGQ